MRTESYQDSLIALRDSAELFKSQATSAPLFFGILFFLIAILFTALSIPVAMPLTVMAGAIFGFQLGFIFSAFAQAFGALCAFLLSRTLFRKWVERKYGSYLVEINHSLEKEGGFYLLSVRLVPVVPFFIVNLVMGITRISWQKYYFFTQLGMLPLVALYAQAGTKLSEIKSLDEVLTPRIWIVLGFFAALPFVINAALARFRKLRLK